MSSPSWNLGSMLSPRTPQDERVRAAPDRAREQILSAMSLAISVHSPACTHEINGLKLRSSRPGSAPRPPLLPVLQGTCRYTQAAGKHGARDLHIFARVADEIRVHFERG